MKVMIYELHSRHLKKNLHQIRFFFPQLPRTYCLGVVDGSGPGVSGGEDGGGGVAGNVTGDAGEGFDLGGGVGVHLD
jgi:hypothetical protein